METNVKGGKAQTKEELVLEVKSLVQIIDDLEEKSRENISTLQNLEKRVENLKDEREQISKQTQTESSIELKCDECNFEGVNERELGWHMGKNHGWPSEQKSEDMDKSIGSMDARFCEKCDYEADSMYDLDTHT